MFKTPQYNGDKKIQVHLIQFAGKQLFIYYDFMGMW